jgi:serine/threonine protein kinase
MEQMDEHLFDAALKMPVKNNAVDMAPVARRMLEIYQAVHEKGCILTDIKPENFMVDRVYGSVAGRLRLIDLGLLMQFGMDEPKEGVSQLRGTPTCASRNVHALKTPTRWDDIEGLLFLLADLMICVSRQKKGSYLPWSQCTSEDDIWEAKEAQVSEPNSELYSLMSPAVATVIFKCLQAVEQDKTEPTYDFFNQAFGELVVPLPNKKFTAANTTPRRKKGPIDQDNGGVFHEEIGDWGHDENLKPAANAPAPSFSPVY